MNNINIISLTGTIRDISYSHKIGDVEYYQANLIVKRVEDKQDVIRLKFKRFTCPYKDGDEVSLVGHLRSYSHLVDGKNKCDIYVYTYFDTPDSDMIEYQQERQTDNLGLISGKICKIEPLRVTENGKQNIRFTLANNIESGSSGKNLNSYIPCIAWGNMAKLLSRKHISDSIVVHGEFHSREYKKRISEDEIEIRVAHEFLIISFDDQETENAV